MVFHCRCFSFSKEESDPQVTNNLRAFTFSELKAATNNFSRSSKIGEGRFGCVYKGVINNPRDSTKRLDVAVKQLSVTGLLGQKEWVKEVNVLGVVDHPNLVKLVGHCAEEDERSGTQRLLVYEYMDNRSVEDRLYTRSEPTLSWTMRLKVALDAARGLVYLHEEMEFKAVGTTRYATPEYIVSGHLTSKIDVWSYEMFLYELITGRRPFDRSRPKNEHILLEWVKPYVDSERFEVIINPRLKDNYSLESVQILCSIANMCLIVDPKSRPTMREVLEMVNQLNTGEKMKNEGETGSSEVQRKESACFPRICCVS